MNANAASGARTRARELVLQALYQMQIAGHDCDELKRQFKDQKAYERVDQEYFNDTLTRICSGQAELENQVGALIDRPLEQLDPVEFGILLLGVFELAERSDVPHRVVINEGVNLAKRFGSIDGYKYINGCLDKAAHRLRDAETGG